jgi:hypothetical protein
LPLIKGYYFRAYMNLGNSTQRWKIDRAAYIFFNGYVASTLQQYLAKWLVHYETLSNTDKKIKKTP